MKIIFLDIDGVLNSRVTHAKTPSGFVGISDVLVKQLADLVEATEAQIVLSSDWKEDWEKKRQDGRYLDEKLEVYNLQIIARTYEKDYRKRGMGIQAYLSENKVENFVILDDKAFDFKECGLETHFVQTNPRYGLRGIDIYRAIQILQGIKD